MRTADYSQRERQRLGEAVAAARKAAGHKFRPSFAKAADVSLRSLADLETGKPGTGEANLLAIAAALPGWTPATPREILEGGPAPDPRAPEPEPADVSEARRRIIEMSHTELALRIAEVAEVQGGEAAGELLERILAIRAEARQRT